MQCSLRWLWAVLLVGVVAAPAFGADEQWLQYRSAREVSLPGDGVRSAPVPALTAEKPAGVSLPPFKDPTPLFVKWQTPMVKAGFLWIALDRSTKAGPYNLLYIDSNGNGRLDDETPSTAYQKEQSSARFGPVKVVFQVEDGPVTYHLNFRFADNRGNRLLLPYTGGWYDGDITIGGVKRHCTLFDYNVNGTFNDESPDPGQCDRITIGDKVGQEAGLVGRYLEADGALYRLEVARDGAFVKLTKADDVRLGRVRLPAAIVSCRVGGENGSFTVKPKDGIASLPVGAYHVLRWTTERTDDGGAKWQIEGRSTFGKTPLEIVEGRDAELDIGEPIVATVQATVQAQMYSFRLVMAGRAGEQIELLRNGTRPQAPKVRIRNADGTYDGTFNFEYG